MTRRSLFAVLAAVAVAPVRALGFTRGVSGSDYLDADEFNGLCPVVYKGDPRDPNYHRVHDGRMAERGTRHVFVDGVDRHAECDEFYAGEHGWANLVLKVREGGKLKTLCVGGKSVRYAVRGRVELREPGVSWGTPLTYDPTGDMLGRWSEPRLSVSDVDFDAIIRDLRLPSPLRVS